MLFGNIADGPQGVNDPKTMADVGNGFPHAPGLDHRVVGLGSRRAARQHGPGPDRAGRHRQRQADRQDGARGVRLGHARRRPGELQALLRGGHAGAAARAADGARARRRRAARAAAQPVVLRRCPVDQAARRHKPKPGYPLRIPLRGEEPQGAGPGLRRHPRFRELAALRSRRRSRPPAGQITHALAIGFSQAGRYLRHHIAPGFNRDEQGRKVFDGIQATSPASAASSSTCRSASRRAPTPSTRTMASPRTWFPFSTATLERSADRAEGLAVPRRRQRSQADRDQHLDRVLAEGRLAAAHRSARHRRTWRCRTTAAPT